jgi:WS/DGAT/MGAT family acyltransferase
VAQPQRLSGLDTSFLHLERGGAHMHVASVMVFEGDPPAYDEVLAAFASRLHLVPRYRQRLAFVPLDQGRPVWVDDPHFNLRYHVRHSAIPAPGSDRELKRLAGRLFAQPLDRDRPLWDVALVEGLAPLDDGTPRFALITKTHHALVDGVSGVDIVSVLFQDTPETAPPPPPPPYVPAPLPSGAKLLADALVERTFEPREILRGIRRATRAPREALGQVAALGALALGAQGAPDTPLNVPIGPHRRYDWVDADLGRIKQVKDALGGTINDAILTSVALALGRFLRERGMDTRDLVLKAMIPVSVRADSQKGALGNRVATMWAPLPVGVEDPVALFAEIHESMRGLKESGQAVGAQALTTLADFAPPTILSQAARLQARQRYFNLVVTNVPGPQKSLYLLGHKMLRLYPVVPIARRQALGIAIMSYDGKLGIGLLGDYDAMGDLAVLAAHLDAALAELELSAALPAGPAAPRRAPEGVVAVTPSSRVPAS